MSEEYDRTGKKVVTFGKPVRWATLNINESISKSRIPVDDDGNVIIQPVIVVDPIHDPDFLSDGSVSQETTIFRAVTTIAAGNTTIWTPGPGRSIKLTGLHIAVSGGTTFGAAGLLAIAINGSAYGFMFATYVYCPIAAVTGVFLDAQYNFDPPLSFFDPGELLRVDLTLPGASTGDSVRVQAWGYEA